MNSPPTPSGSADAQAQGALTHVVYERGQWVVYLDVVFGQELRRFRIDAFRTQRLAIIAAVQIQRYADRNWPPEG